MRIKVNACEAVERLTKDQSLDNCSVNGQLWLGEKPLAGEIAGVHHPVRFVDCDIDEFNAAVVLFYRPVSIENCLIRASTFYAAYFFEGLEIRNCEFEKRVDFSAAGHNPSEYKIRICATTFHQFVDFDDSYFDGPVEVINCCFQKGTNLHYWVRHPFGLSETGSLTTDRNVGKTDLRMSG